jgi:hypothetical protein
MGTSPSKSINTEFGSIYGLRGNPRPGYYFSKNKIIYKGTEIPRLEHESNFQKLKYGYLKSNRRVFYKGVYLPLANPATFSVITRNNADSISRDPNTNIDLQKYNSVLGMDFIRNKKRIYFRDRIVHEE